MVLQSKNKRPNDYFGYIGKVIGLPKEVDTDNIVSMNFVTMKYRIY